MTVNYDEPVPTITDSELRRRCAVCFCPWTGEMQEPFEECLERLCECHATKGIRPDIRDALDAWAKTGRPVGGFLEAVLTNDLFGAVGRADAYNIKTIPAICSHVYNELPSTCWGSPAKVLAWSKAHPYLPEEVK